MIILDTPVLVALMRERPDPHVLRWLDAQNAESIWITGITVFEARVGLQRLAPGRRRQALEAAFETLLTQVLDGRILDFDAAAAHAAAQLAARRERAGSSVDMRDTQLAGIVIAHGARLATASLTRFAELQPNLIDPFAPA